MKSFSLYSAAARKSPRFFASAASSKSSSFGAAKTEIKIINNRTKNLILLPQPHTQFLVPLHTASYSPKMETIGTVLVAPRRSHTFRRAKIRSNTRCLQLAHEASNELVRAAYRALLPAPTARQALPRSPLTRPRSPKHYLPRLCNTRRCKRRTRSDRTHTQSPRAALSQTYRLCPV